MESRRGKTKDGWGSATPPPSPKSPYQPQAGLIGNIETPKGKPKANRQPQTKPDANLDSPRVRLNPYSSTTSTAHLEGQARGKIRPPHTGQEATDTV